MPFAGLARTNVGRKQMKLREATGNGLSQHQPALSTFWDAMGVKGLAGLLEKHQPPNCRAIVVPTIFREIIVQLRTENSLIACALLRVQ